MNLIKQKDNFGKHGQWWIKWDIVEKNLITIKFRILTNSENELYWNRKKEYEASLTIILKEK